MRLFVYWNSKDHDCEKIFHFMSSNDEYSLVKFMDETIETDLKRVYCSFDNISEIIEKIKKSDMVLFLTHGVENGILKYLNKKDQSVNDVMLLNEEKAGVLKGKKVLAFCCLSAQIFGKYCVTPEIGCSAFVGFERDIVYDNGKAIRSRHIIYNSYKVSFMKALEYAIKSQCTIEDFRIRLTQLMRQESAKAIMESADHSLNSMYSGTIEGLVALGDIKQKLFSIS